MKVTNAMDVVDVNPWAEILDWKKRQTRKRQNSPNILLPLCFLINRGVNKQPLVPAARKEVFPPCDAGLYPQCMSPNSLSLPSAVSCQIVFTPTKSHTLSTP